jgi:proline dehydrogenase
MHIAGVKRMRDECESAVIQSQIMVDNARLLAEHMSSILSCSLQTVNELEKTVQLKEQQLEKAAQLHEEMLDRKAKRMKMEDESKDRELVELQQKLDIELENEKKKTDRMVSLAERSATIPTHKFSVLICLK